LVREWGAPLLRRLRRFRAFALAPSFFLQRGYPASAKLVVGRGSAGGQVNRRHTEMCGCRCFLPDLTGFADFRCGGPGRRRTRGRGNKNGGIPARLGTWPSMAIGASGRSIACSKGG